MADLKKFLDFTGLSYYDGKIKAYIADQIGGAGKLTYAVVASLPPVAEADAYTIYLVSRSAGQKTTDIYDEYLLINGAFELIGNTEVDFSNYYTKSEIDSTVAALKGTAQSTASEESIAGAKAYADAAVAGKNVSASGETGDDALVTASATGNAVTVGTTQKLKNAVSAAESAVQSVAEGSTNGTISVDGTDVAVHGLDTAAYTTVTALNATAQGYADAVLGTASDAASSATVYGAKAYADSLVAGLNPVGSITNSEIDNLFA